MGDELWEIAAQRIFRYAEFFPSPAELAEEARKVERAKRSAAERERVMKRAEREKRRLEKEARQMFDDAALSGRRIAQKVLDGDLDLIEATGKSLPPATERRYESAGRFEEDEKWEDFRP